MLATGVAGILELELRGQCACGHPCMRDLVIKINRRKGD